MKLVQLDIERLEPSSSNKSTYVLLLREIGGDRKLPIVIGPCNAGSIAIYLESNSNPERPLTHDIIKSITNNFNILKRNGLTTTPRRDKCNIHFLYFSLSL